MQDVFTDRLGVFNKTAAGRALIAAYQASRIIQDLDSGGGNDPGEPPPSSPA